MTFEEFVEKLKEVDDKEVLVVETIECYDPETKKEKVPLLAYSLGLNSDNFSAKRAKWILTDPDWINYLKLKEKCKKCEISKEKISLEFEYEVLYLGKQHEKIILKRRTK